MNIAGGDIRTVYTTSVSFKDLCRNAKAQAQIKSNAASAAAKTRYLFCAGENNAAVCAASAASAGVKNHIFKR